MNYGDHGLKFTKEQKQLLEGERVIYTRDGTRHGWEGTILHVGFKYGGDKFKVTWDRANKYFENFTTYSIVALLHPEKAYISLLNKDLIMSYKNTVTNGKFFMVISGEGNRKTGMVSEEEAIETATKLAQESQTKEVFYVVKAALRIFATKPPVEQELI